MIEWLLDLQTLRLDDPGVRLGFARPIPGWAWFLIGAGALGVSFWSYARLEGSRTWRAALAVSRTLLLLLLVFLVAGPQLIRENETEERDWVLVMVDRSASLDIEDLGAADGSRSSRESQLRSILRSNKDLWNDLASERELIWLGFDAGVFELETSLSGDGITIDPGAPDGRRTALGRSLDQSLRRAAARPLSGIIVISDGQSADAPSDAFLRSIGADQVPIHTIALGSSDAVMDIAVRTVEAPRVAFINDIVPVEVTLEGRGTNAAGTTTTVELVDKTTGLTLDAKEVGWDEAADGTVSVSLSTRPEEAGGADWEVRIGAKSRDLIETNNTMEIAVDLVDRPLRVVYFDGYPRWEQRFIKHLLDRESSIKSSVLLLAANRRYLQEGDVVLDLLPNSPEEWAEFDAIVLGDLHPQIFTDDQLEQIREHVGVRGGGLIWIGGEGATPLAWRGTPLEDLLPFAIDDAAPVRRWDQPVTMRATPAADRLGVLRLSPEPTDGSWWPERLTDPDTGWSQLKFAQRIDPRTLKPTAQTLAMAQPVFGADEPAPVVLSMRYGAGRTLYVGTDEIWRWRYGRGEYFPERFWLQMTRLLGRERLAKSGKSALLKTSPARSEVEQPIRVSIELVDQLLVDAAPSSLSVRIRRLGETGVDAQPGTVDTEEMLELVPERSRYGVLPRTFAGTWLPTESGRFRLESADPLVAGLGLVTDVDIWQPDDELRNPGTDHELLGSIADATGGVQLDPSDLSPLRMPELLPNRKIRLIGTPDIDELWDTPLALLLIVLLCTFEWVGRRLIRLA